MDRPWHNHTAASLPAQSGGSTPRSWIGKGLGPILAVLIPPLPALAQYPAPPAPLVEPPVTSVPAPPTEIPPGYITPNPSGLPLMPGAPAGSLVVPAPTIPPELGTVPVPVRAPAPSHTITVPTSNVPQGGVVVPPVPVAPPQPRVIQFAPASGLPPALPSPKGTAIDDLLNQDISEADTEISVIVGRSRVYDLNLRNESGQARKISRILVANPNVADVDLLDKDQPNAHLLNLYGQSFGATTLTIWFLNQRGNEVEEQARAYKVRVTIDTVDLEKRIAQLFPGADVQVRQVGSQLVLEGQVRNAKMMSDVLNLVYADLRLNAIPSAGPGGTQATSTMPAPTATGGTTALSQVPTTPAFIGIGAGLIVNRVRVPGPRQVLLRVKLAELNRTALRQLGVSWLDNRNNAILGSTIGASGTISGASNSTQNSVFGPAGLVPGALSTPLNDRIVSQAFQPVTSAFNAAGTALVNPTNTQLFGIFNAGEFNIFLNALRVNSLAKILAEPNLMALDGQPASFQAGGSFPYPVPQAATAGGGSVITIQFAQFGAILQFLPQILEGDVIRLDVSPTFSTLDPALGTTIPGGGTVPGLSQRNARTVVELREGQTLAIAGLLQTSTTATTSRIPGLGDLPIVGNWFSNSSINTIETELVVLISPELVEPMENCDVPPAPGDLVTEPTDYEFYFLGRLEGRTGKPFRSTIQYLDPLEVMKHFRSENHWVIGPHGHAD